MLSFYAKGPESVLEGSIAEGQSVRVQGGDVDLVDKYMGDCFSDFRLMMKTHPLKFFSSSVVKELNNQNVFKKFFGIKRPDCERKATKKGLNLKE